ncbi:efflux RND transporter periplasmic adaptor subunit [Flavihumibacter petaseus]|uniref:RND-type efflux pump membrane fusion protein n=1 Tax=Flavihumibacter petaseus NBRC 106054 TaxID=1220578 RepID=A0A0E9MVA9_9BACT|nr:efflux RND transporter periplasmic adaptor subunit [Flavihumibacter petaseus]GAO41413.1 RND-type efflux pump membrane fusion protein [Flavihumibacter petaseus NBRC 106054]
MLQFIKSASNFNGIFFASIALVYLYACNAKANTEGAGAPPPPALPVIALQAQDVNTFQEYTASLEGSEDIEIRPQVDGYLSKIYVDEGAWVKKGTPLFAIDSRRYSEALNNAHASLKQAEANLESADINLGKIEPLVSSNVVSDVQLKTARANRDAAAAAVSQAAAQKEQASINLGYTLIKAPADGYIGRIPYKTGSLVNSSNAQPLTLLSSVKEVYAYFSLSEKEWLQFSQRFPGNTLDAKLKQVPPVELVLADNSVYPQKGRIETVNGVFNNRMGTISLRAVFPNEGGALRSGSTGAVRLPRANDDAVVVPQEATYELQDKVFVFQVSDSNTVTGKAISINAKSGNYYLVNGGVHAGDKIVFAGMGRLQEGARITPEIISLDSILQSNPLSKK